MSRFSFAEADNYGVGKNSYFTLKDDGDTAKVRFLINDINDIQGVAVHEVQVGDTKMDVECLRAYNEPVANCPLCAAGHKQSAKLYVPLYNESAKESQIWTRGKTFFSKLSSLCSHFSPLVSTPFEIERVGKKGDTNTTYETYPMQADNSRIEDFPEIDAEGTCFQVKTYEDMEKFLQTGSFDADQVARGGRQAGVTARQQREMPANTPVRRRPSYNEEDSF